eukprot:228868-Rhodomonas_salina.2
MLWQMRVGVLYLRLLRRRMGLDTEAEQEKQEQVDQEDEQEELDMEQALRSDSTRPATSG